MSGRDRIGVFGAGYVGIVTAAGFAELGRDTVLFDTDATKIEALRSGRLPIYEPGLLELLERGVRGGRLHFTSEPREAVAGCWAVFIAVGTPMADDGCADLRFVRAAARTIAVHLDGPTVIVNKSTVPVETGDLVSAIVRDGRLARHDAIVVSNPEFLREGSAVTDFFTPERIVLGCDDRHAEASLRELYAPLDAPVIVTDRHTAEMIKYTANAFLAMKISFANEIATICERVGADVKSVLAGAGGDKRIGTSYFNPGLGFGGSCLPKDVRALCRIADAAAVEPTLLEAILAVNARQVRGVGARIAYVLGGLRGATIGVLGLAFKSQTDDVRDSASLALVEELLAAGAHVRVHDPVALEKARAQLGDRVTYAPVDDCYPVATHADALVLATEWHAYRDLDFDYLRSIMRRRVFMDARNFFHPAHVIRAGFHYEGIGRGAWLSADDERAVEA